MRKLDKIYEAIAETIREQIAIQAKIYGLGDSELLRKTEVEVTATGVRVVAPEYARYVQSGRPAGALKGVKLPISVLIRWLKNKGFSGDINSIAWAIQQSIYKRGVATKTPPKPFIEEALEEGEKQAKEIIAVNFEDLLKDLVKK